MFSTNPNYTKLKTHLRLSINRLKLLEKKKTELAQKARKEIAEYIAAGKSERAKIRVEHIIRSVQYKLLMFNNENHVCPIFRWKLIIPVRIYLFKLRHV